MPGKWDNYEAMARRAEELFLDYDQDKIIRKFGLNADDAFLYLRFIGEDYEISRRTGEVFRISRRTGEVFRISRRGEAGFARAGFSEVLSILDLLCHDVDSLPLKSGLLAGVNGVNHLPGTIGVEPVRSGKSAAAFDANVEGFEAACASLGGRRIDLGDIGFAIPLFEFARPEEAEVVDLQGFLTVALKFYRADDEFPAQLTVLWDKEILRLLRYETLFYVEGWLCHRIESLM